MLTWLIFACPVIYTRLRAYQTVQVIAQHPKYMAVGSGRSTKQAHYVPHGVIEERLSKVQLNSVRIY